jgi:NAD(P)-dependent dehydrogenase (short-subunit alcohol dehydrogenase family)
MTTLDTSLRLDGQVAIVTGAGSGIGAATARLLAAQGARVVIAERHADAAQSVASGIEATGGAASAIATDVADVAQVRALVASTLDRCGRIDALVNNAGIGLGRPFWEIDDNEWASVIAVNVTGCFHCARAVAPAMMAAGSGAIVTIASVLGVATNPGQVAYTTSKAAVIGMTRAMALDLAPHGVRVNCVLPGSTDTPMMWGDLAGEQLATVARVAAAAVPLRRIAGPDEIANAILFLLSPAASYITGAVLAVDGGLLSKIATDY